MFKEVQASEIQLSEVLSWLEREHLESSEGFYCNKDIIVEAFENGEMFCALLNDQVVGFAIHTRKSIGASIDILEIHPAYRSQGFGSRLAQQTTERLFNAGAAFVTVKCAPRSSELFWRQLGFVPTARPASRRFEPPQLMLRNAA
jgi:ribosomal protein S18 acetylase RimI-like enzyme